MHAIEFFFREHDYNILGSLTNKKAKEYIFSEGRYRRLKLPENPFTLKLAGLHQLGVATEKNTKMNFVFPVKVEDGEFIALDLEEYKYNRANGIKTEYVRIGESDRLKLHLWAKQERNLRYDIYNYDSIDIYMKRVKVQKPTLEYKKTLPCYQRERSKA